MILALILTTVALIVNAIAIYSTYKGSDDINKIGRYVMLMIVISVQSFYIYHTFLKYPNNLDTYEQKISCPDLYYPNCGVVIKKIEGREYTKKSNNEYYKEWLVVKFDNGKYHRVEVGRDTYEIHPVNSRICFCETTQYYNIWSIVAILTGALSFVCFIISIVYWFNE